MAKTFASGNDVETYIIVNHFNRNIKGSYLARIISGKTYSEVKKYDISRSI